MNFLVPLSTQNTLMIWLFGWHLTTFVIMSNHPPPSDSGGGVCGVILTIISVIICICTFPFSLFFVIKVQLQLNYIWHPSFPGQIKFNHLPFLNSLKLEKKRLIPAGLITWITNWNVLFLGRAAVREGSHLQARLYHKRWCCWPWPLHLPPLSGWYTRGWYENCLLRCTPSRGRN